MEETVNCIIKLESHIMGSVLERCWQDLQSFANFPSNLSQLSVLLFHKAELRGLTLSPHGTLFTKETLVKGRKVDNFRLFMSVLLTEQISIGREEPKEEEKQLSTYCAINQKVLVNFFEC